MKKLVVFLLGIFCFILITGSAQASLSLRGMGTITNGGSGDYQLIYDDVLDITWLDFSTNKNTWNNSMSWAAGLEISFGGITFKNWRLPTTQGIDYGYTNEGEMGYLYNIELGNPLGGPLANTGLFVNLYGVEYWLNLEYDKNTAMAWAYHMNLGTQSANYKTTSASIRAIAVMDGDVSAIPVPGTVWLFFSGLVGLAGLRKKIIKN